MCHTIRTKSVYDMPNTKKAHFLLRGQIFWFFLVLRGRPNVRTLLYSQCIHITVRCLSLAPDDCFLVHTEQHLQSLPAGSV